MKLLYQYLAIFFNFTPTSNDLHSPQVENCDSNSGLVVDEDDNDKFMLERAKESVTKGEFQFKIVINHFPLHLNTYIISIKNILLYNAGMDFRRENPNIKPDCYDHLSWSEANPTRGIHLMLF